MLKSFLESLIGSMNLDQFLPMVQTYVVQHGPELAINVVVAVLIFVIGRGVAKLAANLLERMCERGKIEQTLSKFLGRIVYTLILLFTIMAALERVGVNTTTVAAVVAAAGLAVGLALQGSLANFAAGVMIILFRPFRVGDFIEAGGATGIVEEIHIFHTLMRTGDNVELIVPNSAIVASNIANYSAKETRRIDLIVGCGYNDDLQAVKGLLWKLVDQDGRILRDPAPVVAVAELADHSVNFVVRPWVATADYWQVRWDLLEAIKDGFDEFGFSIPYPQRDIHLFHVDSEDQATREAAPLALPSSHSPVTQPTSPTAPTGPPAKGNRVSHSEPLATLPPSGSIDVFAQASPSAEPTRPRRVG